MKSIKRWRAAACILPVLGALAASPALSAQDSLIDRNRPDRAPPQSAPEAARPETSEAVVAAFQPFVLKGVAIDGSSLPADALREAVRPFIGQTLDVEGVSRLRAALASAYEGSPFALPLIAIDARDATQGVLRVTAAEGAVTQVAITGETAGDMNLLRHYGAAVTTERPLSRATAERYLSLITDIPGLKTAVTATPTGRPGEVALGLAIDQSRWEYAYGVDNRGSSSQGRTQLIASATLNGGFRQGDQSRVTLIVPTDPERFQYVSASHRQPLGYDGAAVSVSAGHLRTKTPEGLEGEATTGGLLVSWPMIRSYRTNLTLSGGLDGINSDQAVVADLVSTERTRVLRASAAYSKATPRMVLAASGTLSRGLDSLGARTAIPQIVDLDFTKVNLRASVSRAVGQTVRLSLAASGQWSDDFAPTSELFTLGGSEFGRGFPRALLVGDSGWGARAEAAWRPAALPTPVRGTEVYAFTDGGTAYINGRLSQPDRDTSLASAGLGARIALGGRLVVEVEGARALKDPRPGGDDWRMGFAVSGRF